MQTGGELVIRAESSGNVRGHRSISGSVAGTSQMYSCKQTAAQVFVFHLQVAPLVPGSSQVDINDTNRSSPVCAQLLFTNSMKEETRL